MTDQRSDRAPIRLTEILRSNAILVVVTSLLGLVFGLFAGTKVVESSSATTPILLNPLDGNPFYPGSRGEQLVNLETEAQVLRSKAVAEMVVETTRSSRTAEELLADVSVTVPVNTQILEVTYTSTSPRNAVAMSQAFADDYLAYRGQRAQRLITDQTEQLNVQIADLQSQLELLAQQRSGVPTNSAEAIVLQSRMDSVAAEISALSTNRSELAGSPLDPGQVVTRAELDPQGPLDKKALVGLGGLLAGFALGMIIAVVRSHGVQPVRSPEDVVECGTSVLGSIGTAERTGLTAMDDDVRKICVGVLAVEGRRPFTLLVAPATTTADHAWCLIDLANGFARSGLDTLVIDATLNGTGPAVALDHPEARGLSDVLLGLEAIDTSLRPVAPLMRVLPPGRDITRITDLFVGDPMVRVLRRAAEMSDVVIIASGSVQSGSAQSLANLADSVVIEVVESATDRSEIERASEALERLGGRYLGAVFVGHPVAAKRAGFEGAVYQRELRAADSTERGTGSPAGERAAAEAPLPDVPTPSTIGGTPAPSGPSPEGTDPGKGIWAVRQ